MDIETANKILAHQQIIEDFQIKMLELEVEKNWITEKVVDLRNKNQNNEEWTKHHKILITLNSYQSHLNATLLTYEHNLSFIEKKFNKLLGGLN